jgi:uncharacterized protein YegJ (DUF2314 family)
MGLLSKLFGKKGTTQDVNVVNVSNNDERMNWAIEKANATLNYFQESLLAPQPSQQYFSVKVLITDGEHQEHLWLTTPSFDDEGNLYGVVGNKPVSVRSVSLNQKIGIEAQNISDWMIIENGRLIGGYTIRAIRDSLPREEWAEFDRQTGLYIDEGVDYFKHDFSTPEGAILCLEDAFDEQDADKAVSCKNFVEEARMLLRKVGDKFDSEDVLHTTADILRMSFIKDLQTQGFPVFRDLSRAYPERERITDQLYIITEVCIFPDGGKSLQRLYTFKDDEGWRVIGIAE